MTISSSLSKNILTLTLPPRQGTRSHADAGRTQAALDQAELETRSVCRDQRGGRLCAGADLNGCSPRRKIVGGEQAAAFGWEDSSSGSDPLPLNTAWYTGGVRRCAGSATACDLVPLQLGPIRLSEFSAASYRDGDDHARRAVGEKIAFDPRSPAGC